MQIFPHYSFYTCSAAFSLILDYSHLAMYHKIAMLKDVDFIKKTFQLAKKGTGFVSPNPLVGAILVKNGKIIGSGYHRKPGTPHAEVNAINSAQEDVSGSTLYCNLEPCCHYKKRTGPCVDLIIEKKIAEVVVSNIDPNPLVSGRGIEKLRAAGIKVKFGVLEKEGKKLNEIFFKYIGSGLPFVHLKVAQTLDGRLATSGGDSKWITDEFARKSAHQLRLKYDAVLVGRKTLNNDDPKLSIRMNVVPKGKIPYRIVVGNPQKMKLKSFIFNDEHPEKTIIITTKSDYEKCSKKTISFFENSKIEVMKVSSFRGGVNFREALMNLGMLGITSVLVEGGKSIISSFINQKIFDRFTIYIAPKLIGNGHNIFDNKGIKKISDAVEFKDMKFTILKNQIVFEGHPKEPACLPV